MKVDVGVGGRFWSDRLAQLLIADGHEVDLYTTLPGSRFPQLSPEKVHSFLFPEIVFRLAGGLGFPDWGDLFKIENFGKAMASRLKAKDQADLFVGWSSFSLETMQDRKPKLSYLVRDSFHILEQTEILQREYTRWGAKLTDRKRCVDRECAEYLLADKILVCSKLARDTFIQRGTAPEKIRVVELGADLSVFKPRAELSPVVPLRIVYFGNISFRKGVQYLLEATQDFSSKEIDLLLIGSVEASFAPVLSRYHHFRYLPSQPHAQLAETIKECHVHVLPSVEDGFGLVVPQAMAAGLVPVVSDRCGAAELIDSGRNGFVFPSTDAEALRWVLGDLVGNPSSLPSLRNQAIATAEKTGWERNARSLRILIQEINIRATSSTRLSKAGN